MSLLTQEQVYDQIVEAEAARRRLAVATIVTTSGSTPQRTGAKLLVFEDGRMLGTVGGGCYEHDAIGKARQVLATRKPATVTVRPPSDSIEVGQMLTGLIPSFVPHSS